MRSRALPVLEARLAGGELDLLEALSELDTWTVELDSDLLASINTERELDRLRAITATRSGSASGWANA